MVHWNKLTRTCIQVKLVVAVDNTLPAFACFLKLHNFGSALSNSCGVGTGIDDYLFDTLDLVDKRYDNVEYIVVRTPCKDLRKRIVTTLNTMCVENSTTYWYIGWTVKRP